MNKIDVLLLDNNIERQNLVKTLISEKGFTSDSPEGEDGKTVFDIKKTVKIVLVDQHYLFKLSKEEIKSLFRQAQSTNIIVYDVQNIATRRLAFYKLGAYRVLDKSYNAQEIVELTINILKQYNNLGKQQETRFSGNLLDFSIADLINSFGRDKVSGILRIYTPYCSGKIIFNVGHIDDASSGYYSGEEAVLFMLTWRNGSFSMRKCPIKNPKHRIQLSNIGLLLYGERINGQFNNIVRKLGHAGISVKLINKGDLVQQISNPYYKDIIEKLTHFTVLQELLAYSKINPLELVSWLRKMKKSNHLEIRDDSGFDIESLPEIESFKASGLSELLFGSKEVNYLRKTLKAEEITTGKFLVLGTDMKLKTDFIHVFNQGGGTAVRTNKELDFTRIDLDDYFSLNVFGISIDQKFKEIIEKFSEGLLGYIVLIDAQKPEEFEYAHYVINYLSELYSVPWAVAIANFSDDTPLFENVEAKLNLPENRSAIPCDINQKDDVKNVILALK